MTFQTSPLTGGHELEFKAIYLGDVHSDQYIDRYEGIPGSETASNLSGATFGSSGRPLAQSIVDITVTKDVNGDGQLEGEQFWNGATDSFATAQPVEVPDMSTGATKLVNQFKFDGVSQFRANVTYADGHSGEAVVTVIQDHLGRSFLVPNEDGSDGGMLDQPVQSITLGDAIRDCDNDYDFGRPDGWQPVPCFTAGVRLATAKGQRPVEKLSVGDLVETADRGLQPVRWIGSRTLDAIDLDAAPALRPIRIRKGALGRNLPKRDLLVSPQHRMMVRSTIAQELFGTDEVLVAAKHLLGVDGVDIAEDVTQVTYLHVLFDQHEVVFAEGAESESLYTGPEALRAVGPAARAEILALFPELDDDSVTPAARPMLSGRQGRDLASRHAGVALQ